MKNYSKLLKELRKMNDKRLIIIFAGLAVIALILQPELVIFLLKGLF